MKAFTKRFDDISKLGDFLKEVSTSPEFLSSEKVLVTAFSSFMDKAVTMKIIDTVKALLPRAFMAGTTSIGYNSSDEKCDEYLICSVMAFETDAFDIYEYDCPSTNAFEAGMRLGKTICQTDAPKGVLLFPCDFTGNFEQFLSTATICNKDIPFFGAFSGTLGFNIFDYTELQFETSYLFTDRIFHSGGIAIVFHGEDIHISTHYSCCWHPLGKTMKITGKEGNFISTIDDYPANYIFKKYFGVDTEVVNLTSNIAEFPLLVQRGNITAPRIAVGAEGEKVKFASDMHLGETITFSYGNAKDMLRESFRNSEILRCFEPQVVFLFICAGRHYYLKEDSVKEISYFKRFCEEPLLLYGSSEILKTSEGGGELNSSLVAVGIREGEIRDHSLTCDLGMSEDETPSAIPFTHRVINFLEATTDELAQAAEEARVANRSKSDFLSRMSHEIRSPLNAILGLDEMIQRESTEKKILEYASDIQSSGRVLLSLINDILDLSKIEAGKMELLEDNYDPSSTINDLVNMILVRAREKGLKLITEVDEHLPSTLCGDETRLRQCILNILTNSVKYTNEGSVTFSVSFEKADEDSIFLKVKISDTGIGIKEEDLEKLTRPYERIEVRRNKKIEGTGLGMNIVTSLLSLMGSSLKVESVYGEGSVFSFSVKQKVVDWTEMGDYVSRHEQAVSNELSDDFLKNAGFQAPDVRILAVDDTPINLQVLTGLLKRTRIRCDTAESGEKALEMANETKYDLFLIDHMMPEMDGIETLEALKILPFYADNRTPAIALTANATNGAREMYLNSGFSGYLSKPVSGRSLEKTLESFLPPEKLIYPGQEGYEEARKTADSSTGDIGMFNEMSALFLEKFGVDIASGLANSGGKDIYDSVVKDFQTLASMRADELEKLASGSDLKNFTIKVHALKSSARLVGALELSKKAAHLEECGNRGDIDEIRELLPSLLEDLRSYTLLLAPLAGVIPSVPGAEKPGISEDELEGALLSVKTFAEAFDFDSAEDLLNDLSNYDLPAGYDEKVRKASDMVRLLDRDGLLELL